MKKIIIFVAFSIISMLASAYTLSGRIKTDADAALPFVSVYFKDAHVGATTDLDGKYTIADIPAGRHTLVVSYVGYETQTLEMNIDKDDVKDFVMREQAIVLDNVFITPTGESIERFILSQVVKHTKKLTKRMESFSYSQESRMEQRNNNLKVAAEPYMKMINLVLGVMGYRDIFNAIFDYPDLRVEMKREDVFTKGKLTVNDAKLVSCTPQITEKEKKTWIKFFSKSHPFGYDSYYDEVADIKKKLEKMDKKSSGESEKHLSYGGEYDENGTTIHILQYDNSQYHIVDGCWQIRRIADMKNKKVDSRIIEFQEFAKNVYMPVSKYSVIDLNIEKVLNDELDNLNKENTSSMSTKQLEKHNDRKRKLQETLDAGNSKVKISVTLNYKDFKPVK